MATTYTNLRITLAEPLGDVLVGTHRVGQPKTTKAFFNIKRLLDLLETDAKGADLRATRYFFIAHFDHELHLLPAIEQLAANARLPGRDLRTAALIG